MSVIRDLKDYRWVYNDGKIYIIDKKNNKTIELDMTRADSFSRACISFRNVYRIEQVRKVRELIKKNTINNRKRINKFKEIIDNLKAKYDKKNN